MLTFTLADWEHPLSWNHCVDEKAPRSLCLHLRFVLKARWCSHDRLLNSPFDCVAVDVKFRSTINCNYAVSQASLHDIVCHVVSLKHELFIFHCQFSTTQTRRRYPNELWYEGSVRRRVIEHLSSRIIE